MTPHSGQLVGWLGGWFISFVGWLVGYLVGWVAWLGYLVAWLAGRAVGRVFRLVAIRRVNGLVAGWLDSFMW